MNNAIINIKTEPNVKKQAQKVAKDLGLTLSSVINGYLKQFVRSKTFQVSLDTEQPSPYLLEALREAQADVAAKRLSPRFKNAAEAIAWLNK